MGLFSSFGGFVGDMFGLQRKGEGTVSSGYSMGIGSLNKMAKKANKQLQPWADFGRTQGLEGISQLQNDPSSIKQLPYYNFIMDQGLGALSRQKSAGGKFFSGETAQDLINYASGVASTTYGEEWGRRMNLANLGYTAAGAISNNYMGQGSDLASLYANQGRDVGGMQASRGAKLQSFIYDVAKGWAGAKGFIN